MTFRIILWQTMITMPALVVCCDTYRNISSIKHDSQDNSLTNNDNDACLGCVLWYLLKHFSNRTWLRIILWHTMITMPALVVCCDTYRNISSIEHDSQDHKAWISSGQLTIPGLNRHLHQTVQSLHSQLFSGRIEMLFIGNIGQAVLTEVDNLTEPVQQRQRRAHL